jgi:serine/threonine-protein kinase
MSDPHRNDPDTEQIEQVTARFEGAWQEALKGGPPPEPEAYLTEVSEAERAGLERRLAELSATYRPRLPDPATVTWVPPANPGAHTHRRAGAPTVREASAEPDASGREKGPALPDYEVLGELGRGGMGVVYLARQRSLDRLVALKMVLAGAHASDSHLVRFQFEAKAAARLRHPNIVQVYEAGRHEGVPYFSQEYVDGGSLAQHTNRQPQPPAEAARLVETLARAVHHAHTQGVVHRDLKPANVLLASGGRQPPDPRSASGGLRPPLADCTPKIADFGLAKRLDDEATQTQTGAPMGTPSYMSPEQARGGKGVGPATDVYALGAILYELLVGRPPFLSASVLDTLDQVRGEDPVPPTRLQPKLPRDLETVCLKCLQKDPQRRYPSAEALADDLRRFLKGEPITARPVGPAERLGRWCRRNPRLAGLSAAVLLLLAAITIGSLAFAYQLDRKQREAEAARQEAVEARGVAETNAAQARAEKERADANARDALDRYNLALDALNVVVGKVQARLDDSGTTARVRHEILLAAMGVLQKSVARKDRTGLAELGLASAHMIMGDILWGSGKADEAVRHYDECHAILTKLYEANRASDKAAGNYAASLSRQADMWADYRKDLPAARARYREALAIQQDLLAHPRPKAELTPAEIKATVANSYQRLGEIALRMGPDAPDDPDDLLQQALALREELAKADHGDSARQKLADAHLAVAARKVSLDRIDQAREHYDACLALRTALVREDPYSFRKKADLLRLCGTVGDMWLMHGDAAAAKAYYGEALGPTEKLAAVDDRLIVQRTLGQNYYRMATACLRLNDPASADLYYHKCLEVRLKDRYEHPDDDNARINLMIAQARCGQHREAAALAAELLRRRPKDPGVLFQAACCYALCGPAVAHGKAAEQLTPDERDQQKGYARQAVEALRQARANGYRDVKALQTDPDLDPVRESAEFRTLLDEMTRS